MNELDQRLCSAVDEAFESEHVPWFQQLVEQPSYTRARRDVESAAALIDAMTDRLGMRRQLFPDPAAVFADHRVYSCPGTAEDDQAIAVVGHCDTVYPRSQDFLAFRRDTPDSPSAGDHVYGPGVLDMKSGLSVVLFALRAIAHSAPDIFADLKLRFVCNTDEEVGSPTSRAVIDQVAAKTSIGLVFEGGREGDRIITTRKGTGTFTLTVTGKEAHAGNQHSEGINAIHALALLIPHIESLTAYADGTTINVGLVEGGTAKNTVPGQAQCTIDVRVSTAEQAQHVESSLQRLSRWPDVEAISVPARLREAQIVVDGAIRRPPMEATPATQALRTRYEAYAQRQGLGIGEAPPQGGGSDANLLAARGVPTIDGLGPYGKYFHSTKEWSSLGSLRQRTKALACFLAGESAPSLPRQ